MRLYISAINIENVITVYDDNKNKHSRYIRMIVDAIIWNSKFGLKELKFGAKSERISVLFALLTWYAGSWDLSEIFQGI